MKVFHAVLAGARVPAVLGNLEFSRTPRVLGKIEVLTL